jgi:phage/conjugal plasmid C-4 type zinc finger TraR family protein
VSDNVDRAQERELLDRELALAAQRARTPRGVTLSTTCEDCGESIEPKRRELLPYTQCCASCAHDRERDERCL